MKKIFCLFILITTPLLFAQQNDLKIIAHSVVSFDEMRQYDKAHKSIEQKVIPIGKIDYEKLVVTKIIEKNDDNKNISAPIQAPSAPSAPLGLQNGFLAIPDGLTSIPPDTMGAAGPNHLMATLNTQVRIQDKSGTTISTVSLDSFWSTVNGGGGTFDPKIYYDTGGNRFIFVAMDDSFSATSGLLIGVTETSDPTGNWYLWKVDADASNTDWADFPSIGFNSKWIAFGVNMYNNSSGFSNGSKLWVFDKTNTYANNLLICKVFSTNFQTMVPCVTFGSEPDLYTVESDWTSGLDDLVRIDKITGPLYSPSFNFVRYIVVPNTLSPTTAPQLGGLLKIENGDMRISASPIFRFGHIFFTYCGRKLLPERNVIVWGEIDPNSAAPIQTGIVQETTVPIYYAFPSIAVNSQTSIVLGFSGFSTGIYASAFFTGRERGDTPHTMRTPQLLKAGEDYYYKKFSGTKNRWGDYSATCIDPANDLNFWTIQEYARPDVGTGANDDRWGTWWGEVYFVPEPVSIYYLSFMIYYLLINRKA
jgi:hypothetical protein